MKLTLSTATRYECITHGMYTTTGNVCQTRPDSATERYAWRRGGADGDGDPQDGTRQDGALLHDIDSLPTVGQR